MTNMTTMELKNLSPKDKMKLCKLICNGSLTYEGVIPTSPDMLMKALEYPEVEEYIASLNKMYAKFNTRLEITSGELYSMYTQVMR